MASKGRRRQNADPPRRGFAATALDQTLSNPMTAIGSVVMVVVGSAILTNALMMQPGAHPAPLFNGTSPLPSGRVMPPPTGKVAVETDRIGDLLGGPAAIDPTLLADTQSALKALGVYTGAVDGLDGPMTRAAIRAFQGTHGLEPTGEPSQDLLTILNVAVPHGAGVPAVETPAAAVSAPALAEPSVATDQPIPDVPLPRPSPLRSGTLVAEGAEHASVDKGPTAVAPVTLRYTPDAADRPSFAAEPTAPAPVSEAALEAPQTDPRLARIQEALDAAGYGPLRADGLWSQETSEAIRRFEENRGLVITGRINEAFLAELVKIGGLVTP